MSWTCASPMSGQLGTFRMLVWSHWQRSRQRQKIYCHMTEYSSSAREAYAASQQHASPNRSDCSGFTVSMVARKAGRLPACHWFTTSGRPASASASNSAAFHNSWSFDDAASQQVRSHRLGTIGAQSLEFDPVTLPLGPDPWQQANCRQRGDFDIAARHRKRMSRRSHPVANPWRPEPPPRY